MTFPWKYISLSFVIGLLVGVSVGLLSARTLRHRWMRHGPELFLKRLDKEVHLTADQRAKLEALIVSNRAKIDAQRDATRQEIRQQTRQVLTPEQQPAFDRMIAKMEERRKKWERP